MCYSVSKANEELLGRLGIECVFDVVRRGRLRWFGQNYACLNIQQLFLKHSLHKCMISSELAHIEGFNIGTGNFLKLIFLLFQRKYVYKIRDNKTKERLPNTEQHTHIRFNGPVSRFTRVGRLPFNLLRHSTRSRASSSLRPISFMSLFTTSI